LSSLSFIVVAGLVLPQNLKIPVQGADKSSYNANSFWYYPWGRSGTHKGVDIFSKAGTQVSSATTGLVVYTGNIKLGGKVILVLGPKWRVHYYAHLKEIKTSNLSWVSQGKPIGTVGTSGNAAGKQPHLHYSITSLIPLPWRIDSSVQGWKKMFYLNPIDYF
jgi:murein DD-endopeptidase MepM/ murein hydrolase activator NlpD